MSQQQISVLGRNFSARLKELRGQKSQAYFAKTLGINHQQTYHRYESGKIPTGEILHQIAVKVGTSVDWLLSDGSTPSVKSLNPDALEERLFDSSGEFYDLNDQQLDEFIAYNYEQLATSKPGFESMFVDMSANLNWEKIERVLKRNPSLDRKKIYQMLIRFFEDMAAYGEVRYDAAWPDRPATPASDKS